MVRTSGDEMNVFVSQSIQTQIELEEIADVKRQVINPGSSKTIIGIIQDGLIGSYNITAPSTRIDWKTAMNIVSYTSMDEFKKIKKEKEYSGSDVFSLIIPSKINLSTSNIKIKNGEIQEGFLSKEVLGDGNKYAIHQLIWDEYGVEETKKFLNDTQRLINNFNVSNGFSIGIGDVDITEEMQSQIDVMYDTMKLKATHMITEFENNPEIYNERLGEELLLKEYSNIRNEVSKLLTNNLSPTNAVGIMMKSGSKGDETNLGKISGCVGAMTIEGKLPIKKLNRRTLPYFHQDDDRDEARGVVRNSFRNGLKWSNFVFLVAAGREGLIDVAIKSVTGDTPIVILEDGNVKHINIGDWIDKELDKHSKEVEHYKERDMELLRLKNSVYIPTTNEDGNVSWGEITAITRHDPGKELYEIKTQGGRKVIVTESKSLLIWNEDNNKFEMKSTPEVKLGDFVPVTSYLTEPPVIKDYIDMTQYFSKQDYIYGTDFIIAKQEVNNAMDGREKIPAGWWKENNGKLFTLPYDSKARFTRCINRSIIDNIKEGYIYPYSSNRESILIPDKFKLDKENGRFIGLFLADGNVDIKSGYIQISKNNDSIISFAENWFNNYSIKSQKNSKINHINALTNDIRGYSTIMCKFLTELVGHGSRNKHIPYDAINAPEEFIIGIIEGYFSGDGTITKNAIQVTSASEELINGINMLLSRLNIFGKVGVTSMKENNLGTKDILLIHTLSIRGQWAKLFSEKITIIEENKNDKLKSIKNSEVHKNFRTQNDVVLDKIIEINIIDVKKYPKVYDLTIPSTLNFGLANGLHVVDTAESGYIQRKLVKSLEDIIVAYDGSVRSASDAVIQFAYGDSGANPLTQFEYKIKFIEMGNSDIKSTYKIKDTDLDKYSIDEKENEVLYEEIIRMRDLLRETKIKSRIDFVSLNSSYMIPINIHRIIINIRNNDKLKSNEKLSGSYIIQELDKLLENTNTTLLCMGKKSKFKSEDEQILKTVLKASLYDALAPGRCIYEYHLNKAQFEEIIKQIKINYNKNLMEAGELVGILSAQSMGEPVTQMNLKSFHHTGIAAIAKTLQGVPRVKELLSLSKNIKTPQMVIHLTKEYIASKEMVNKIASYITFITIGDIRKSVQVFYDPNPDKKDGFTDKDNIKTTFYSSGKGSSCEADANQLPWLLRIVMDKEKMLDKGITLFEVKSKFCNAWEKRYSDSKFTKKEDKSLIDKISGLAILSNTDNDKEPVIHIRIDMNEYSILTVHNFIDNIIEKFKLKGIPGIQGIDDIPSKPLLDFDNEDKKYETKNKYEIYTAGVNMDDIRYIKGIDIYTTTCNDIMVIFENFGIEAARMALLSEITYAYNRAGKPINYQHLSILVDVMTNTGILTSIDRHGMNKSDNDPLQRASFEKVVDQLLTAAVFNEVDYMKGVSSRIMAGLVVKGGTGMCDLILDTEMLENSEYVEDIGQKYEKTYKAVVPNEMNKYLTETVDEDVFMPV
jgi:DNA-directed RNA polymerase beta' subunit